MIRIDAESPLYDMGRGELLMARKDAAKAEKHFRKAIEKNPDLAKAHYFLAESLSQQGKAEPLTFTLPERIFTVPLARALVEQRRDLALDYGQAERVLDVKLSLISKSSMQRRTGMSAAGNNGTRPHRSLIRWRPFPVC